MTSNLGAIQQARKRDEMGILYERVFHSIKRYDFEGNIIGTFDRISLSIRLSDGSGPHYESDEMYAGTFRMVNPTPQRVLKAARKFVSIYKPEYAEPDSKKTSVTQHGIEYKHFTILSYERENHWGWIHVDARPLHPYSANINDPEIGPISLIIGVD